MLHPEGLELASLAARSEAFQVDTALVFPRRT